MPNRTVLNLTKPNLTRLNPFSILRGQVRPTASLSDHGTGSEPPPPPVSEHVATAKYEADATEIDSPGMVSLFLVIMAAMMTILCWLGSPYWQTSRQVAQIPELSEPELSQLLPTLAQGSLLSVDRSDPVREWKGPGKTYLQNQWKTIQHHQTSAFELQQALLIQRGQGFKRGYLAFPNMFYWTQGTDRHQVRLEFTRVGFWHWELSNACYPFAQPWPDARICPSDTR